MLIENFLNSNPNWEEILTASPYNIKVVRDGDYILLNYSQLESDFSNDLVQQCRGSIFTIKGDKYVCVCRPFRKFFNVQEPNASYIDWSSASVQEKVDGSIMKVWFDRDLWHLSTNGTIDAFKADAIDGLTFGDLFERVVGEDLQSFCKFLSPYYTYIFELTTPETQIVIPYEDGLYWLATKDTETERELKHRAGVPRIVKNVRHYDCKNLNECLAYVNSLTKDEEGFVVVDGVFNRIKIKTPQYLLAHHALNNNVITYRRIMEMIREEKIDDFLALCPQWGWKVGEVLQWYTNTISRLNYDWSNCSKHLQEGRKQFAAVVKTFAIFSDYCFRKADNHRLTPVDYWNNQLLTTWERYFELWKEGKYGRN